MASPILTTLGGAAANTVGQTVAFAGGTTASHALTPYGTAISQEAFKIAPIRVVDALLLSVGVAQGQIDPDKAAAWATASGFNADAFAAMVEIANTGPALGSALELLRRGDWTETQFHTALRRQGIERQWWDGLTSLQHERLELGALATAVHRGIMDDAGLLVTPVPTGEGNVPRIPVSRLDTLAEFAAHGIDPERARVLVGDTGLPLSLGEMLALLNRGKVTETDVQVSIAESNLRNEYMDVALELRRRLLTPHEQAESELRGIKTRAEAEAGAALSGLEPDDYETLFGIMGRPLNPHQITTGLARGGKFGGGYDTVPEPYQDAIRRSAIRPEYADLAYHDRYTYPSAFVMRSLAEAGDLGDTAAVAQLLEEIGWKPSLAKQVAAKWTPEGSTADPHVAKARTQLWTATHGSYVKGEIGATDATAALTTAGVDPAAIPDVLATWDAERALVRKQLSVKQIQKALTGGLVNPDTGVAWTKDDATAAFLERGYSAADAQTLIAEA